MNLDYPSNMAKFVERVGACLYAHASRAALTDAQAEFCEDMKWRVESRADDFEVTNRKWNPTVNQWNYLSGIFEKL